MLRRLLITGLAAGFVAGLLVTALQSLQTVPLIHLAELYESGELIHGDAAPAVSPETEALGGHEHGQGDEPEGLARLGLTLLANVVTGVGFGLLLACAVGLFGRTRLWQGLLWGLGGFLAFAALPALGLPPKLPGMEAGPLVERQLWWVATAAASVAGLGLLAFARPLWLKPLGLVVLALPHLIGAPLGSGESAVPPELAQRFVVASLATAALFWLALGVAVTGIYRRLDRA